MQIDAVITYVNGNDPVLNEKRKRYGTASDFKRTDIAGVTRYADNGEIFWCVASLNRFAPWLHKIYIVTDGQDPHLDDFVQKNFPNGHIPMQIVDHKEIFAGYEQYLPVFNSVAIETMTWRIPGLSEHFIEMNDDCMLAAPIQPADLFPSETEVVCHAWLYPPFFFKIATFFKRLKHGKSIFTNKQMFLHGAARADRKPILLLRIQHTPKALLKSFFQDYFEKHPQAMIDNIRHKFRNPAQFSTAELQYVSLRQQGRCRRLPVPPYMFYFMQKNKPHYFEKKMARLNAHPYRYCCFNGLNESPEADRMAIRQWIQNRLDIEDLPE